MAQNINRVKEIVARDPRIIQQDTPQNLVAMSVRNLAMARGVEINSDEYLDLMESQLAAINDPGEALTPEEKAFADELGLDRETYAQGVQERDRRKREGYYGGP